MKVECSQLDCSSTWTSIIEVVYEARPIRCKICVNQGQVVGFKINSSSASAIFTDSICPLSATSRPLEQWLEGITVSGSTFHLETLRNVIILLTWGESAHSSVASSRAATLRSKSYNPIQEPTSESFISLAAKPSCGKERLLEQWIP